MMKKLRDRFLSFNKIYKNGLFCFENQPCKVSNAEMRKFISMFLIVLDALSSGQFLGKENFPWIPKWSIVTGWIFRFLEGDVN